MPVILLDITGRKVMELQPGEAAPRSGGDVVYDVRHLSPVVYFVRAQELRGQGVEGANVRKLIVTK